MKSEKFRVKISIIPFLLSVGIVFLSIFLSFFLKNEALKGGFLILSLFYTITIVINLYNFIFTRLSIKENTLTGFNGIFSRVKIPIDRITLISVSRPPLKIGGRTVFLLTKARDLVKIRYVSNYDDLIDKLELLNKNIMIDNRIYTRMKY